MFDRNKFEDIIIINEEGQEVVKAVEFDDGSIITYPVTVVEQAVNNPESQSGEWLRLVTQWQTEGRC